MLAIHTNGYHDVPKPQSYVGDFNCQHVNWGYNRTSPDGESLESWTTSNNLGLLHSSKETSSFFSHRRAVAYSAVEWTRARVDIRRVVAPAPQPEPATRPRSATCDVSFLRSDSRCPRYVSNLSNVTPRYLG